MNHIREDGSIKLGFYCGVCGLPSGTQQCAEGEHRYCTANPKLTKKLYGINKAGSLEAYTFKLLQEK